MAKKPVVVLRLNGKPLNLNPPTPSVERILSFLDKQSKTDLFTAEELVKRSGVPSIRQAGFAKNPAFIPYSLRLGRFRYWGNPTAVKALREKVDQ